MNLQTKPLNMQQPLSPEQMRKLIVIKRPAHNHVGCMLCLSNKEVRVIESPGTEETLMICKPCLNELARRNIS